MTFATRSTAARTHAAFSDAMPVGLTTALAALPVLEALEGRQLLAASQAGSVITLSGNASSANTFDVKISGGKLSTTVNGATTSFTNAAGLTLKINGGSANDKVNITDAVTAKAYIDVGAGNDSVRAGGGPDTIYAGAGNDTVNGGLGTDTAYDAESVTGATSLKSPTTTPTPTPTPTPSAGGTATQSGSTITITGKTGSANVIDVKILNGKLAATVNGTTTSFTNSSGLSLKITGGTGNDKVTLTDAVTAKAFIDVGAGNDSVRAGGGNDTVYAGAGSDTVDGGNGTDVIYDGESVSGGTSLKSGGTTTTPTPTPTPTPSPTGGTGAGTPASTGNYGTPTARITSPTGLDVMTGMGVHVDGLSSSLNGGQATTGRFEWDFGDSGSRFNKLVGFNAAHVYDHSGTYTITLKVINEGGKTAVTTTKVTVGTDTRQQIYVSSSGNDSNPGTASAPIKTFNKAAALALWADDVEILFKAGDTFAVGNTPLWIHGSNVLVGSYGSGAKPVLKYSGTRDAWHPFVSVDQTAVNTTVQGLTFDSVYTSASDTGNMPVGMWISGKNTVSRNNNFVDVGFGHDVRPISVGTLIQDGTATKATGLREYYMWAEGTNVVAVGNTVANSTREHVMRMVGASKVLISNNDLTNLDRRNVDGGDDAKGVVVVQKGQYYYVANNKLNGPSGFGPLGKADGLDDVGGRTTYGVFEANYQTGGFEIRHGSQHIMVRNNIFDRNGDTAVSVDGYNAEYHRGSLDVTIVNNTAFNDSAAGKFIQSAMPVEGIKILNNLYVAPNLQAGPSGAAGMAVIGDDLSSFTKIDGNNWGAPALAWYTDYGINSIGSWGDSSIGVWQTAAEWNNYAQVGNDSFTDVSVDGRYKPNAGQAGTAVAATTGVITDFYGNYRPSSGWLVGAVQG